MSDYNEQHMALGCLVLQKLSEIHPEWDVVHVHEQLIAPKRAPSPRITFRISVAHLCDQLYGAPEINFERFPWSA